MSIPITSLPVASTIDAVNDTFPIVTNSLNATQQISRNTFLNLASQPVGLTDTQTLTNKTLTSPTINTPTISSPTLSGTLSGTYTIGGTPTFPSSVATLTGSQTLTNKTLTSPIITNATLSSDTITGFTVSNTGTIYGVAIATGTISSSSAIGNGIILPQALLTGTGASWSFQTWTPTLTNLSGGSINYSKYIQIGKTVFCRFKYTLAGAGVSGTPGISLPVTANSDLTSSVLQYGGEYNDSDGFEWNNIVKFGTTSRADLYYWNTSANLAAITSSAPFTWANADIIVVNFIYEAA